MITWSKDKRSQEIPLSGPIIMAKAADFAQHLNILDSHFGRWFHHFRDRHDLVSRSVCSEPKAAKKETCPAWRNGMLQEYMKYLSARHHAHNAARKEKRLTFNAPPNVTALFFKLLPEKKLGAASH